MVSYRIITLLNKITSKNYPEKHGLSNTKKKKHKYVDSGLYVWYYSIALTTCEKVFEIWIMISKVSRKKTISSLNTFQS